MRRIFSLLMLATLTTATALAQEAGWHYSPLPREGDRAAMGCGSGSTPEAFACLVVRCEDNFTVGLHIHTSRPGGDVGKWRLDIDKDSYPLTAGAGPQPYRSQVVEDPAAIIDALKQGAVAYLEALDGEQPPSGPIPLSGSLYAINQALYFCAPKVVREAPASDDQEPAVDG